MAEPQDVLPVLKSLVKTVSAFAGRVDEALDLAELLRTGQVPNRPTSAWVIPAGLRSRSEGDAATGAFTQALDEYFAVVIALRSSGDRSGGTAAPQLHVLVWSVVQAVVGVEADTTLPGLFRLVRGQTLSVAAGLVTYQLDFAIQHQLRNI